MKSAEYKTSKYENFPISKFPRIIKFSKVDGKYKLNDDNSTEQNFNVINVWCVPAKKCFTTMFKQNSHF